MRPLLAFAWCVVSSAAPRVEAQDTLPPIQGGYIHSLGLPEIFKPYLGVAVGLSGEGGTHLRSQVRLGVYRDLTSPVIQFLGWSVEYHAGLRDVRFDQGGQAVLSSRILGLGAGIDYSVLSGDANLVLAYSSPIRRGGLLGRGSELRAEWLPTHHGGFNLAFTIPLHQPNMGVTRPSRNYVGLRDEPPRLILFQPSDVMRQTLAELRQEGLGLNRLTVPYLGGLSDDPGRSAADAVRPVAAWLTSRATGGRTAEQVILDYHAVLLRAFSLAVEDSSDTGSPPLGATVAAQAQAVLLDRVLFPYNRLLGQRKKKDTTREFGSHARGVFARWLVMQSPVPRDRADAALYVFQCLLDLVEEIRAANREAWGDSRLVWLPLQLALSPDEYDGQEELDSLLSLAVGRPLTHGNRLAYVYNERFQQNLRESIGQAEDYHVLWVHDFRGLNDAGKPDRLSLFMATSAYLAALRDRVRTYDSTGRLPVYMLFLDQLYFEQNKSRDLLNLLQDPLGQRVSLPAGFDSLQGALNDAQQQLRQAVAASRLLQTERAQYGDIWLRRLVKVHVSVTNPADPSFRSPLILPLLGVPDDVMRDHRKAVLYDVSEANPYRGKAMFAGMGVGELYAGPMWEDRAVMLQGPAALALRDAARKLLETNGLEGGEIPQVLRPQPKPADYDSIVGAEIDSADATGGVATRAIELFNGTGFAPKEISVADATLFNLLSPGGVLKVPDSLWLNELLASLLTGAGLRGVRVLMILPSRASAPSAGWPQLALMHDLGSRMIAVRHELSPVLDASGGVLRVGCYDARAGVDDLKARVLALRGRLADTPFLRQLFDFIPAVSQVVDSVLGAPAPFTPGDPAGTDSAERPKLHFKGFLYVSREEWASLISGPPMAVGLREYLRARREQVLGGASVSEAELTQTLQRMGAQAIDPILDQYVKENTCHVGSYDLPADLRLDARQNRKRHVQARRCGWASFLQVGSPNQDYRSMVMDGEGAVLVSDWTSLYAVPDFVLLTGLTTWPEDQEEFDRLLPRPGMPKLILAWWVRMML